MTLSTEATIRPLAYTTVPDAGQELAYEQAKVRGHAAGFAAGVAAGTQRIEADRAAAAEAREAEARQGKARLDYMLSVLQGAGEAMHVRAAPVLTTLEETLAAAALDLAEAILGHELTDGEDSARSALARATGLPTPSPVHTIRMNPEELAVLDGAAREATGLTFVADPSLRRGDAVAEYADGFLDARLSTALGRMRAVLAGDAV
jgi:flagellar assembly protein FliH